MEIKPSQQEEIVYINFNPNLSPPSRIPESSGPFEPSMQWSVTISKFQRGGFDETSHGGITSLGAVNQVLFSYLIFASGNSFPTDHNSS